MKGVFTALISPLKDSGELDLPAYKKLLEDQADAGVAGVVPCGTTGESPTLSREEKQELIRTALDVLRGTKLKVVAGTGSNDTAAAIEFSRWASDQGAHGLLLVTPYYNKPTQAGLIEHFNAIADQVSCEIMLYNVPGRTGISMTAETVVELAGHSKIRSLKEATANVAFTSEILDLLAKKGRSIDILSGDDATYLPLLSVGASGVVSVASNLFPRAMVKIQNCMEQGKIAEAREIHKRYYPLFRDLFVESNPAPIKYALHRMGWCTPKLRRPLVEISEKSAVTLNASLEKAGIRRGEKA